MKFPLRLKLRKLDEYDLTVMLLAIALTCFGVVMVYSASSIMAAKRFQDGFFFLKRQGVFALIGFAVMLVVMQIDYHRWKKVAVPALLACLLLLILVLVPGIGGKIGGSSRWIKLPGFNLQPSEMAKIALIIYMAYTLDKKQDKMKLLLDSFIPYMVVLSVLIGLMIVQPDLGGAMTLAFVALVMLFTAGARVVHIFSGVLLATPLILYKLSRGYHKARMEAFFNPWSDPEGKGFQIIQSLLALGTGGFFGQGLGEGKQKLFYLPEAHTDFILSVIGEEFGFLGILVIVGMFLLLILRAIRIAISAPDIFGRFLAMGIAVLIAIEALVNMAVVTGMAPTKGLALPFISYGGSSLLVTLFAVGILLNISAGLKLSPVSLKENK